MNKIEGDRMLKVLIIGNLVLVVVLLLMVVDIRKEQTDMQSKLNDVSSKVENTDNNTSAIGDRFDGLDSALFDLQHTVDNLQ